MSEYAIVRTRQATGSACTVAVRATAEDADDLAVTLNRHAVGYVFTVQPPEGA